MGFFKKGKSMKYKNKDGIELSFNGNDMQAKLVREVVEEVARMRCKNGKWGMPELFDVKGLAVSFEDKQDAARFAQVMAIESEPVELVETVHDNDSGAVV